MSYIQESLSSGEQIIQTFEQHWFSKVPMILYLILSPLTAGITLPLAIYEYLKLRSMEHGVTNKRIIIKRGIISRKTEEMKITSVETVEINQGVFGRIFGFGSIKVTGRGISDCVFKYIDDPMMVKKTIEGISNPIG